MEALPLAGVASSAVHPLESTQISTHLEPSPLAGVGIIHLFSLGLSARQFLVPHFCALAQQRAEQLLVCSEGREGREAAERGGMRFEPVRIAQSIRPIADIGAVFRLTRLFRRECPAMVIAHMSKAAAVGLVAAWITRVRSRVYYNHGMALFSATGLKRVLLWLVEWISCASATRVVFCSQSTKAEAVRLGVVSAEKAQVVGEGSIAGVDTTAFAPAQGAIRESARRALNVPLGAVAVGFVGRQVPHKGLLTVLEAWRALDEKVRSRAVLVVVGGMPTAAVAEALDQSASEDNSIIVAGTRTDMPTVYAALDLVVLPSWHEGFPYSLLEAQASGVPVIASAVTGNIDAVIPDVTGTLVPPRDPDALAASLTQLIDDPDRRAAFGRAARERICRLFSRERVIADHLAMYGAEVEGRGNSAGFCR
jgi:glycosyltransferase involved in cell wall biosynthesis